MAYKTLQSAYNQIRKMTDYMNPESTYTDPDPWEESPFVQTHNAKGHSDRKSAVIRENAEKIYAKLERDGEIASDEAVKEAMNLIGTPQTRLVSYYLNAGPVAATADNLRWNTAFGIDLEEAPTPATDAYRTAASELTIPDTPRLELVPEKVEKCYKVMYDRAEKDGESRVFHPEELRSVGPMLHDGSAKRAFDYLAKLPGIEPPVESGPAWEYVTEETATSAEKAEAEA